MKTLDEIYGELQGSNNNELNKLWQEVKEETKRANKISLITCLIIDIFAMIFFLGTNVFKQLSFSVLPALVMILIINLFIVLIIHIVLCSKKQYKYNETYKEVVIKKLISNFYNNSEYFPKKPMPEYIWRASKFDNFYDRYNSEDYFEAQIDNENSIQMAEVLTQEVRTERDSEGRTRTTTVTRFHGLFAKIVMNKSIKSELRVIQNGIFNIGNKLEMDSTEFEKYFDVQASDKIMGMQILTADIMEELIEFENNTKMKFDIFIKDNEIYLRFHSGEMFEPGSIKKEALNKETINKYFYMLNLTYNLSNRLIEVVKDIEM